MAAPYKYRLIDPDALDVSDIPTIQGNNASVLADGLLDVIHIALDSGMTVEDVNTALGAVTAHLAVLNRNAFRIHGPG